MKQDSIMATQNCFTKFWIKTRVTGYYSVNGKMIHNLDGSECWSMPIQEFYCPWYAKPLDFLYHLIYKKAKIV